MRPAVSQKKKRVAVTQEKFCALIQVFKERLRNSSKTAIHSSLQLTAQLFKAFKCSQMAESSNFECPDVVRLRISLGTYFLSLSLSLYKYVCIGFLSFCYYDKSNHINKHRLPTTAIFANIRQILVNVALCIICKKIVKVMDATYLGIRSAHKRV